MLAALAVASALVAAGPAPAQAADPRFALEIAPITPLPLGTVGQRDGVGIQANLRSSEDFSGTGFKVRMTVDGGLYLARNRGIVPGCDWGDGDVTCPAGEGTTGRLTLKAGQPLSTGDISYGFYRTSIYTGPDAKPGKATFTLTVWNDDMTISASQSVTIQESVNLTTSPIPESMTTLRATVGTPLTLTVGASNHSDLPLRRPILVLPRNPAIESTKRYSNCRYDGRILLSCTFEQQLMAKKAYRVDLPLVFTGIPESPYGKVYFNLGWYTEADLKVERKTLDGTPGTEGPLLIRELAGSSAAPAAKPGAEQRITGNWHSLSLPLDISGRPSTGTPQPSGTASPAPSAGGAPSGPATAVGGVPGSPAAPAGGAGAGDADDEPTLPLTGPATGILAAVGLAALVGGLLLVRRRRTRFEA
ncbi:hypothetical protein [Krasilnikovia cinnamomea]|uniref:hypothetical protein n=1 Tax=Krasilnikovia cinnamomea TaxID=349313 RepID=UPI00102B7702|nr:hypothetical protein [Krasilnikovia cinnamomea]